MTLTQQTFFGASIRQFNATAGWGDTPSILDVDLVEDATNGDSFDPPVIGSAVVFNYDQWQFGGILQSYGRSYGQDGAPIYHVQVKDPRELLSGVQLILNDYSGSTYGVPNLYNIYGYLENLYGFGGSQVNENGMPWWLLRNALYALQLTTPIYFRGDYYIFDPFFGLPLLPDYYRVGGDHMSALEFIQNTTEAISADFMVEMIPLTSNETSATNYIKVRLINRNYNLRSNSINDFVSNIDGAVSKQNGYELSNEVMSKFVVGGKVNSIYFQSQDYTSNNTDKDGNDKGSQFYYDDVIIPYWGTDAVGNLIIGHGDFNSADSRDYKFTIDGRPLFLQTGKQSLIFYQTDLSEMQALRAGQEAWESFLWFYNDIETSIHYRKAEMIGISDGKLSSELLTALKDGKKTGKLPSPKGIKDVSTEFDIVQHSYIEDEEHKKQIAKVYMYLNKYATEYYGKKFMVRIPFVAGHYDSELDEYKFSLKPTHTGYVDEQYWSSATQLGYMPYNPEKFTDTNNKIYSYVRFSGMSTATHGTLRSRYGFDKLPLNSYILDQIVGRHAGIMRENLFVKCSVDENIVYIDKTTLYSPRVVITLDAPVTNASNNIELHDTFLKDEVVKFLKDEPTELEDTEVDTWGKDFLAFFGNDFMWHAKSAAFCMPDMAAIPLENQTLRYGPWYISNAAGRVSFENDSSLVPWNFGGFTAMNYAGWAKVESALISQQVHETGSVEYPGAPALSIGQALLNSGPIVTDVNVSAGPDGLTTRYQMITWTHVFGDLGQYNVKRFKQIGILAQQQRKAFRKLYGYKKPIGVIEVDKHKDDAIPSKPEIPSSSIIVSELSVTKDDSGTITSANPSVVTMHVDKVKKTLSDDNYENKAGVSLDAIYSPYTTKVDSSGILPHFDKPNDTAETPTVNDLTPFGTNSIGKIFPETTDGKLPNDLIYSSSGVKSVAFRTPMVLCGWGYDINGNPVPTGESSTVFHLDYKTRADLWKAGPLDVRWDDNKKVWIANGGDSSGTTKIGIIKTGFAGQSSGLMTVYNSDGTSTSGDIMVYDWLLATTDFIPSNTRAIVNKVGSKYYIVALANPCYGTT